MNIFQVHFSSPVASPGSRSKEPFSGCFVAAVDFNGAVQTVRDTYGDASIQSMTCLSTPGIPFVMLYSDLLDRTRDDPITMMVPPSTVKSTLEDEMRAVQHRYEVETGKSPLIGAGMCSSEYSQWMEAKLAMIPPSLLDAWSRVYQNKKA